MGTLPLKKVNNADAGDADHVGGNDWDDLSDFLNDVDKTGPAKINTNTEYRSGKFKIKDSDNTHAYIFNTGNISVDRTVSYPALTADDTIVTANAVQTLTNKTLDATSVSILQKNAYKYVVYIDTSDSNRIKCMDQDTGTIVENSTSALTTLQYAVDNAGGKPILVKRGTYSLSGVLNCIDKYVWMVGEGGQVGFGGDTKLSRAGDVIDMENTTATQELIHLENLAIDGVDNTGTGIRMNDVRQCFELFRNVAIVRCDVGLHLTRSWYDNFWNLRIESCNKGLWIENNGTPSTQQDGGNTLYFFGGKIQNNGNAGAGYDIYCDVVHDASFFGTIIENSTSFVPQYHIILDPESEGVNFYSCSLESFNAGGTIVHDEGRSNRLINCRFEGTFEGDYTAYEAVGARSCSLEGNTFGASSTTGDISITIDSASSDIVLINNTRRRWIIPLSLTLTDNSTTTTCIGNTFVGNKFGTNTVEFRNYTDYKRISAPGNPSTDYGRMYTKQIDSNNDGLFMKIKKNNGFQEVQIA